MAKITASEVNKLRQQTGAGMMDCKKALVEADGDFDKAIEILRKKGQKVAAKRGDNEASEGLVVAVSAEDGAKGVIIKVNCETDFVAKNDAFGEFATSLANKALENGVSTVDELKALPMGDITVGESIVEQIGKIGEKIEVSQLALIDAASVVAYNHPGNQVAALVGLSAAGEGVAEAGRDVAMQAAAMAPVALNKDGVSQEIIDKELEIGKEMARKEGKPEEMLEKIAMGRLNKFFKENTLVEQAFIKDNKQTVKGYLDSVQKGLEISAFNRFALK
jgi:elongation factor Ts